MLYMNNIDIFTGRRDAVPQPQEDRIMQITPSNYLIELLATIAGRPRLWGGQPQDRRSAAELCALLLTDLGDVSSNKVSRGLLAKYAVMTDAQKHAFFQMLGRDFDIDPHEVARLAQAYATDRDAKTLAQLTAAAEPRRQEILRRLNRVAGATEALVAMRCDLLRAVAQTPELAIIDHDFLHLFRSWFNQGFLVLRRIGWHTPANILEKIIAYEAVHAINTWDELRLRLLPEDRRCYAYFHPCMPEEPLIFVEVALTQGVADNVQNVLAEARAPLAPDAADTAVFYSISNCQDGLRGISFGNSLIKQVVEDLRTALPKLTTFVTLSPLPGFRRWAEGLELPTQEAASLQAALAGGQTPKAAETLRRLAARYLIATKRPKGDPLDPVARFHLGNGALVHKVHAGADVSANGLRQSAGVMVNYLYDIDQIDKNIEGYSASKTVAHSRPLAASLKSAAQSGQAQPAPKART
jgi:malonyl-CoA decarboxylase